MLAAQREELVLDASVDEVVGGLLADVGGEPVALGDREGFHHHPRRMGGAPNEAHFARGDQLAERGQRLFLGYVGEGRSVQLVEVDVIGLQALKRSLA